MINSRKKGFTLVELVIVIAVVAILAAVLIPTFSSLVKKANIANDTAVAKNLNTAAIAAQADNFDDAFNAAKDAGYLVANLNAKAEGCFFVWEEETNQFLLYDLKEKNIIYSNTKIDKTPNEDWCFAVNNNADEEEVIAVWPDVTIKPLIVNIKDLNSWLANIKQEKQTIYLDESLVIDESNSIKITGGDITFDLGDSSVTSKGIIEESPIFLSKGSLTIKGGTINANGMDQSIHGKFAVGIGYEVDTKLVVEGVNFIGTTAINGTWNESGQINITVIDSTFNVENSGIVVSPGAVQQSEDALKVVNCNITAGVNAIFISQGTKLLIDGGNYKGQYALYIHDNSSSAVIKDGNFDGEIKVAGNLVVESGTFKNSGLSIEQFKKFVAEGKTVTETNGVFEVK